MEDFVDLSAGGVVYDGPRSMVQFEVESTEMVLKDPNFLVVEITLKRMFQYHLAATYVPSALLIIVTTITLFVDEKHYGATIMVHLTTMLVMFTLYQSVSDNMPKTAYLKFIDKWLLFGIVVPFMTFLVETLLILLTSDDDAKSLNSSEVELKPVKRQIESAFASDPSISPEQKRAYYTFRNNLKIPLRYAGQIMIPLAIITFFMFYTYLAYAYYK